MTILIVLGVAIAVAGGLDLIYRRDAFWRDEDETRRRLNALAAAGDDELQQMR